MSIRPYLFGVCGYFLITSFQPVLAQPSPRAPAATPSKGVAPEIRDALERMSNAMKAQTSITFQADRISEEVLEDGEKIQSSSVMKAVVRRPDRLYIEILSERRSRNFFYDGKSLTIYGPAKKYYATVPAPPTIGAMLREASDRYGVETPLLDIFEWAMTGVKLDKITSAMDAGPDMIGGRRCEQYAIRQEGVDWQVWIPDNDPALPCKLVIIDTVDPSHPQTSAVFSWTPTPGAPPGDDRFAFTPPEGAQRITLIDASLEKKVSEQ